MSAVNTVAGAETAPLENGAGQWQALLGGQSVQERLQAWLAVTCEQVNQAGQVKTAVVLEYLESEGGMCPVALWPAASEGDDSLESLEHFTQAVSEAIADKEAVFETKEEGGALIFAYPVLDDGEVLSVLALEVLAGTVSYASPDAFRRRVYTSVYSASFWLKNLYLKSRLQQQMQMNAGVDDVNESLSLLLQEGKFQEALFDLVGQLRKKLGCTRVVWGRVKGDGVVVEALSDAATFERRSQLVSAMQSAMAECMDAFAVVEFVAAGSEQTLPDTVRGGVYHRQLAELSNAKQLVSIPLIAGDRCESVLLFEREAADFSQEDLSWLGIFAALAAPVARRRYEAQFSSIRRLWLELKKLFRYVFGAGHLTWKAGAVLGVALAVMLFFVPVTHRVNARTVIEGEVQRAVSVPFQGFLAESFVRPGDKVGAGQVLAKMDDQELRLEKHRWESEKKQLQSKYREVLSEHDLAAGESAQAQLGQAQAQLDLAADKLRRTELLAPFDGVVVSGDWDQKVGAPVQQGQQLFEVAPLHSYRIILEVDERDIRHVQEGQQGAIVMSGISDRKMPFQVGKITPLAVTEDGVNFFKVEAVIKNPPERLRPGMEGVGKIHADERSLWWVLTHRLAQWLQLQLWKWLP